MLVDQFSDHSARVLNKIIRECHSDVLQRVKTASIDSTQQEALDSSAFADPYSRQFPIDTAENALVSSLYIQKQAAEVPEFVKDNCSKALRLFRLPEPQLQQKVASADADEDESTYKVATAQDVQRISDDLVMNRHVLPTINKVQMSLLLVKQAALRGLPVPDIAKQYCGLYACDTEKLADTLSVRALEVKDPALQSGYRKVAEAVSSLPKLSYDRPTLTKIASVVQDMDDMLDPMEYANVVSTDAVAAVFNTTKLAEETIRVAGAEVPLSTMLEVPVEVYKQLLGEDVVSDMLDSAGELDQEMFKTLWNTVPFDIQKSFSQQTGF